VMGIDENAVSTASYDRKRHARQNAQATKSHPCRPLSKRIGSEVSTFGPNNEIPDNVE